MARPLPPINAARSPATLVPLTFPIPCWLSVRVYRRETEAPLKSLFPFVTFSEDRMVKEGMNAGASRMELLPPVTKIMNDLLCHVSLPNGDHKSGVAVISANDCVASSCQRDPSGFISKSRTQKGDVTPLSFPVSSVTAFHLLKPRAENSLPSFVPISVPIRTSTSCLFVISPALI